VTDFNSSTRAAEQGIERLHAAADGAGRQIERQIQGAARLLDDMQFLIDRGELVANRLEATSSGGWEVHQHRLLEPVAASGIQSDPPAGRPQSQAERDLLKALRLARA